MSSLDFSAGDSGINVGNPQTNPEVGTLLCWTYLPASLDSNLNRHMFSKRDIAAGTGYCHFGGSATGPTSGRFTIAISYATKDSQAEAADGTLEDGWNFLAATIDAQVTAPRLFRGKLSAAVAEVGYASSPARATGTGARVTDGGANAYIGLNKYQYGINAKGQWPGYIAFLAWYPTVLTDAQIAAFRWMTRAWLTGATGIWRPGWHGLAGCPDMSGNVWNGTIGGGATIAAGLPIGNRMRLGRS